MRQQQYTYKIQEHNLNLIKSLKTNINNIYVNKI